jgi:TonB family protein
LSLPHPTLPTLVDITFEDPDADLVPGVIAPTSAPYPDPSGGVDASAFAIQAGLVPGESVTIILQVNVLPDGSAGAIALQSSSGNPSADSEAIAFARALRWIPGTLQRRAVSMLIQYAVTLTAPS